jgi:hypothetical protein
MTRALSPPSLAKRVLDLKSLCIPNTRQRYCGGKELIFSLELSPTAASRIYTCEIHLRPGLSIPKIFVVNPDLRALAGARDLPHIYTHNGRGTRLCLWRPMRQEWHWSMKLSETCIPWTLRWLWYFEDWLHSNEWAGGGEHPDLRIDQSRQC